MALTMHSHQSHLCFWAMALGSCFTVYLVSLVVYRLLLHPLAKYPGPFLGRLTNLDQFFHAWRGDRHLYIHALHERYGPVVRFGPGSLSFRSADALHDLYGSFKANVRKADFYDAFVHPTPNTHNTRDRAAHARKRRVLAQGFADGAVRGMTSWIVSNVNLFCRRLGDVDGGPRLEAKGWTAARNMGDWCSYLAMDILGDLCFGKSFQMLERDENRFALDLVAKATRRHLICGTMPIVDKLHIDRVLIPGIAAGRARYMTYSRAQLAERTRIGDQSDRKDFFYHLLRARDPETGGEGFTTAELWGESNLLIIAGADTTSTAMAATLFYLVRCPRALQLVTDEVRAAFADAADVVPGPTVSSLAYLRACIDEAMRLSPSVGGLLPREVLAGGVKIAGHTVPAGTVVGVGHYAMHHDREHYPQPYEFVPERWIVGAVNPLKADGGSGNKTTERADLESAQASFCPFSIGPRGCIGKGLAYVEMTTALARLLFEYDIRKPEAVDDPGEGGPGKGTGRERRGEYQLLDTFTSTRDGPMVEVRRR